MDRRSAAMIVPAVAALTAFCAFTGAGAAVNCLTRHKSEKNRRLKGDRDLEDEAKGR